MIEIEKYKEEPKMKYSNKTLKFIGKIVSCLLLCILFIAFVFPFYWMLSTSVKDAFEAIRFPPTMIPASIHVSNYAEAWQVTNFVKYGFNSIVITISTVFLQLLICIPAAYAFARMKFRGQKIMYGIIFMDLMIPAQAIFIPIYLLFSKIGWLDTYQALIVPFIYSAFSIFFMTNAFKQVPNEIIEAARLDGSSELSVIFKVVMPMIMPVIITLALITFIHRWNDYFWCLVLTNKDTVRTLPFAISAITAVKDGGITRWDISMAGNVMLVMPLLILYVVANKRIKNAFAYSGIK
jgi:sn-glycerol 3-phosphate transport system permease protein